MESGFPGEQAREEVSGWDIGSYLIVALVLALYVGTIRKFLFEESVQLYKEMFLFLKVSAILY